MINADFIAIALLICAFAIAILYILHTNDFSAEFKQYEEEQELRRRKKKFMDELTDKAICDYLDKKGYDGALRRYLFYDEIPYFIKEEMWEEYIKKDKGE